MHLLVTDRLACARCGPTFGLVLFSEEMKDRRVLRGFLGCSNCRDRYPIEKGFGDLRPAPREAFPDPLDAPVEEPDTSYDAESGSETSNPGPRANRGTSAVDLAALVGVREGPGLVLLTGSSVSHAGAIAEMIGGIEVVAADAGLRGAAETRGVSRIAVRDRLPFFTGSLRGVVLEGPEGLDLLEEGIRVLSPSARLVLRHPPHGAVDTLEEAGVELLAASGDALVARAS